MNKKQQLEFEEKINRLVEFYNALSDDEKMAIMLEKIDALHDIYVSLQVDITLLQETLHIFMKKFDEDMDMTDKNVETIKNTVIKKFNKSLLGIMEDDIIGITKKLKKLEGDAEEDINEIIDDATSKVEKQADVVTNFKIESKKFNVVGFVLITISVTMFIFSADYYYAMHTYQDKFNKLEQDAAKNKEYIYFLKEQSDKRFDDTLEAYRSIIDNKK